MSLDRHIIRMAYEIPSRRKALLPLIKIANLSTLDVRIFDFVRNQFLQELTDCFVESFDYKTTITKKDVGYIEGQRGQFAWRLKFDIIHRGNTYEIETTLHAGTSFRDAQFVKFETGQQESISTLFEQVNRALAGFMT
jgi:hypothetical protein